MQLDRLEAVAAALAEGRLDTALEAARAQGAGEDVMAALRRERSGYALALGIGDLAGALSLTEVVEALSDLADRAMELKGLVDGPVMLEAVEATRRVHRRQRHLIDGP